MYRTIYFSTEQLRSFDLLWSLKDVLTGLADTTQDILGGTTTVVSGLAATATTPASLVIDIAAGRIYQSAQTDATPYGALGDDTNIIFQQGLAPAQTATLSTSALSAGQSQWALIECSFSQIDEIRVGDPTGGVLYYYNSANPSEPFQGPGGDGATNYTVRETLVTINVLYGPVASSGSEVPPTPSSGSTPLYLIDLTYGQTQVTQGDILISGPSVGNNVPSDYPYAPFLAGLLNSHHDGNPGQAPKINLQTEVQGVISAANLPFGAGRTITASGAFTINNSDAYINLKRTSSPAASSATLPTAPVGNFIQIEDGAANFSEYPVTISAPVIGGVQSTFPGNATTFVLNIDRQCTCFRYYADSNTWTVNLGT